MKLLLSVLFFCLLAAATAMPPWSWDVVPTYFHCANVTGEWNDAALQYMATKPFVVFEKNHGLFADPVGDDAEDKIVASCKAVKALNASTQCLMYVESDWARSFYSLGHWVATNKETAALQCPGNGDYVTTTDHESNGPGTPPWNATFYSYDFSDAEMQAQWVRRVTDAVATGFVDGAFIDGDRNGFWTANTEKCNAGKVDAYKAGLNHSVFMLAKNLSSAAANAGRPTGTTLITNYPTKEAMALCQGGMVERGMGLKYFVQWEKNTCGLDKGPCLLDYHVDHGTASEKTFLSTLTTFLLGVYKYAYIGLGAGWSGSGAGACSAWLEPYPEYSKPLGEPLGHYVTTNGTYGEVMTRKFSTGTKVYVGQHVPPAPKGKPSTAGSCIFWSDGTVSGNASQCDSTF